MKKVNGKVLAVMMACIMVVLTMVTPVSAAASVKLIEAGCETKDYDVTGDGKKDKFLYASSYDDNDMPYGYFMVNGKRAGTFTIDEEYSAFSTSLISLKNGKKFLLVEHNFSEDTPECDIMVYSKGQFKKIAKVNDCVGDTKYGYAFRIKKAAATDNTVNFDCTHANYTFGDLVVRYAYTYKDGKLVKKSSTGKVVSAKTSKTLKFTAAKAVPAYKSATSNTKSFTIKKDGKVTISKISYTSKAGVRVYVKYGKKSGWVKCSKAMYPKMFKGVKSSYF